MSPLWQRALLLLLCHLAAPGCSSSGGTGGSSAQGRGAPKGAAGATPTHDAGTLTVTNWNVHDMLGTTSGVPGGDTLSPTAYAAKLAAIGSTLAGLAPDVAVLAEVGTTTVLEDLNRQQLASGYQGVSLIQGNDPRGINVGVLSRYVPESVVSHKAEAFTRLGTTSPIYHYARDCLEVHLRAGGRPIVLLAVHFKAKSPDDDPEKRLAEAQHTRALAEALAKSDPTAGILVLGDFNDVPGSPPVNAVTGADPLLFPDAAGAVASAQRYSYVYLGQKLLIDHQLANPTFAALLDGSATLITHGAGIDDGSTYASDHSPLTATYRLR